MRKIYKLALTLIHKNVFTRATVPLSTTLSCSGEVLNAVTAILSNSIVAPSKAIETGMILFIDRVAADFFG